MTETALVKKDPNPLLVTGYSGDHSEIGFALLLFDPVDLFPSSEVRIVKFLSKRLHTRKRVLVFNNDASDEGGDDVTPKKRGLGVWQLRSGVCLAAAGVWRQDRT
jgi:hypothetical protein